MTRLFDVYMAVDWSARTLPSTARPTHDAIWVGEKLAVAAGDPPFQRESYWRTRFACYQFLRERLIQHVHAQRRVLLGFDFAFGYPTGFATALGLSENLPAWRATWNEIVCLLVDDENNRNNRFEVASALNARCGEYAPGPFWGCPVGSQTATLARTSPTLGYPYPVNHEIALERLRYADKQERGVQPVWKLLGSGSVGGQTLVGIPVVNRLHSDPFLTEFSRIWPFETGFTSDPLPHPGPYILYAEIWPGIVSASLASDVPIRDQAQVRAVVEWLSGLDAQGQLNELFAQPPGLSAAAIDACVQEEGWILGAGL